MNHYTAITRNSLSAARCFVRSKLVPALFLTLSFLLTSITEARAQDSIEEGYYYFENKQNSNSGYYLVPAKSDDRISAYYHANEATPFITTFKTNKDDNSIWYLEKVTDGDDTYYRFIHCLTGQYITFNEAVDIGTNNPTARMRFHLETFATPSDMTVFWIGKRDSDGRLAVRHKDQYDTKLGYYFWDIGDGNKDNYWSGAYNGTLGLWQTMANINSAYLWIPTSPDATKDLCLPPVITYSDGTVTISYPVADATGVTIRYTTDGYEPTALSADYKEPFTLPAGATKIKAITVKGSFTNPTTRVYNVSRCAIPVITNNEGKITITTATEGATIYYALSGKDPTPHATSATTKYTAPFDLDIETDVPKIRAIAVMEGDETSASDCGELEIPQCEKPSITNSGGTITMSTATEGAEIHYGDNNNPRYSHTTYTEPYTLGITQAPKTIYARAFKAGYRRSEVASLEYKKLDTPKITAVNADGSLKLNPAGATFRYATSTTSTVPGDPGWGQPELVPSSTVVLPIGTDVKIVKIRAYKLGNGYSDVLTYNVPVCDAPVISVAGSTVTLTCAVSGAEIWYSTTSDGNDFVQYSAPFEKTTDVVRAYARKVGYNNSAVSTLQPTVTVSSTEEMTNMGGSYKLSDNFVLEGSLGTAEKPFTGEIDGQLNTIKGITTHPLIAYARDAVIHDVIIEKVDISGDNNAGAICNEAVGATRIYNCGVLSGTVSGANYVGGLVGKIDDNSRVINCYSFADITGGTEVAGIVGYNSVATTQDNMRTMVMNCMFYGNLTSTATTRHPVYGGKVLANNAEKGVNNYNYYRDEANLGGTLAKADYYCSWPAEESHLTRFEYFRSLLNSNRELCAWWITGDYHKTDVVAKWVLDTDIAKYPILKEWGRYPSVINRDPAKQNKLGTLTVTVNAGTDGGSRSTTLTLPITDMDEENHDYGYYKVQLPYYNTTFGDSTSNDWNTRYAGNYTDKVVTGWKVTAVMGGTPGTFEKTDREADNAYNFADRNCTNKDLYDVSGRVFAQGGYYYVPEGVKEITIEAYWGKAIYLQNRDHYLDRVNINSTACGSAFKSTGTRPNTFNGQTVYHKMVDAVNQSGTTGTVYDYGIVLIGNVQHYNGTSNDMQGNNNDRRYTLMSADLDFDDEPDYCLQLQLGDGSNDANLAAARFDFLTIIPLGEAVKLPDKERYGIAIFRYRGFFEVTETSMFTSTEFNYEQYNSGYVKADGSPFILNGGQFPEEFISSKNDCTADRTLYFIVGGNATFKMLALASHNTKNVKTRHCPISVMGGEFETVSLSGLLQSRDKDKAYEDNPRLYTNGGKFGIITGAGQEAVNGDVIFRIDHSIIGEFYGGGQHATNVIEGNIDIVINNSRVDKFCGGPMMGDMKTGKTITTRATGTTFGRYYGAGNGGTAYSLDGSWDNTGKNRDPVASDWEMGNNQYVPLTYINGKGYRAKYKFQIWNMPSGTTPNHPSRRYLYNAQFAKTTTRDVTNILEGCNFEHDFYGAGNLGAVDGNVTSTLTNCKVNGSVFGGGYSASMEPFAVYTLDDIISYPWRDASTGICHDAVISDSPKMYVWTNETSLGGQKLSTSKPSVTVDGVNYIYTTVSLENLGAVSGKCTLTLDRGTKVAGSVYGGGNESAVSNDTTPANAKTEVTIKGGSQITGDVFGGGNNGNVSGSTTVNIEE